MINVLGGINMTFGEKLKKLRIEQKLSQEDLANQLGVSRQAISKWEQDIALPDTNNLILIAKIFKVSLDDLVNYNDDLNNVQHILDEDHYGLDKVKKRIIEYLE